MTLGGALSLYAVHRRGEVGLVLYVIGMLLILVPAIAVAGTVLGGVTANFIARRPERASTISAIAAAYILIGGGGGSYVVGLLCVCRAAHVMTLMTRGVINLGGVPFRHQHMYM